MAAPSGAGPRTGLVMTPVGRGAMPRLEGIGVAGIRAGGRLWPEGVILSAAGAIGWSDDQALPAFTDTDLVVIGADDPDAPRVVAARVLAETAGVAVELMHARAAAHAWVVLAGEGRRVMALIAPPAG